MNRSQQGNSWKLIGVAVLGLFVSGCKSTQAIEDHLPYDIPEVWNFDAEIYKTPMSKGILGQISDVQLLSFIEKVAQQNPDLESAYAQLMIHRSQIGITKSQLYPSLSLGVGSGKNNTTVDALSGEVGKGTTHSLGAQLAWEIDLFGKLKDRHQANSFQLKANEWRYYASKDATLVRSIQQWIYCASLKRSVEIADERVSTLKEIYQRVSKRYSNGLGEVNEFDAARMRLALGKAEVAEVRESYERSTRLLQNLTGEFHVENWDFHPEYVQIEIPSILSPQEVLFSRPDVKIAMMGLYASVYSNQSVKKAKFPAISFQGSFGKESIRLEDLLDVSNVWSLAFSATKSLFDGGSLKSEIEVSQWEEKLTESELRKVLLAAFGEIQNAIAEENRNRTQLKHLIVADASAERNFRYYEKRYLDGLDPIILMLNAKEEHLSISSQLNDMRAENLVNRIQTILALGYGDHSMDRE